MSRYWSSDPHFGHRNIIKFEAENRPFSDTDEMDEALIRNHNAVVGPDDIFMCLGDAVLGDFERGIERLKRLNGYKILVPGNHDRIFSAEKPARIERFMPKYLEVFDDIWPETNQIPLADGTMVAVSHFPYEGDHSESDRHADKRPIDIGLPLIHGHVHGLWKTNGRMFNVGVDVNGLTPVHEDVLIEWARTV